MFLNQAFADDATSSSTATPAIPEELSSQKMMTDNLLILGLLFFIFYFILIRPQQRKLRAHQAMMKTLQKGDKVMTTGGIYGTILKFEGDDIAVVEIAQGVKIRVARVAVSEVVSDKASGEIANDN